MKKIGFILAFAVSLSAIVVSCNSIQPRRGADGYQYTTPEYEQSQMNVNIQTYKSQHDFDNMVKIMNIKVADSERVAAFSILRGSTCTIHIVHPSVKYEPEFYGHELMHCYSGQFHKNNFTKG